MAPVLPVTTKFELGESLTDEQLDFFDVYGFLHFEQVASTDEVIGIIAEVNRISRTWDREGRTMVNGIPLFWGRDHQGARFLQRLAFTSQFSNFISEFVRDERFEPIRKLVGEDARVGEIEKDGVVFNSYMNTSRSTRKRLGWHTDGLRDLCYLRMPQQMLNVGLHLDDITADDGGLRLIPGTHTQGFRDMCFRKKYFFDHSEDEAEICVETQAGDLTVHDGRLWHRVARSKRSGSASLRRSMFVPYLTGPFEPKDETAPTPPYHTLGHAIRLVRDSASAVFSRGG